MCGVVGIYNSETAATDTMLGLFAIQNRGQESCGIAVSDGNLIRGTRGMGLVKEILPPKVIEELPGKVAVGHVRYPTRGTSDRKNSQPHILDTLGGTAYALASNGDITNYSDIRKDLESKGVRFKSNNDGELLLRYISYKVLIEKTTVVDAIKSLMENIQGAFSTVLISREEMWAFRDPYAVRPFSWGKTREGSYAFASESKALDLLLVDEVKDVEPASIIHCKGDNEPEVIKLDQLKLRNGRKGCAHCVFEPVYFSMPDTFEYGVSVYQARKAMGHKLAEYDKDLDVDVVIPVPDSSNMQALGYAEKKGIPFEVGLIRNHYVGRTFIKPNQHWRDESVKQKFNPVRPVIAGRRVVLIDDSIVRGTTMRKIVGMMKNAGASEVHIRIASPPVRYSCYYGIDTPTRQELLATNNSIEEIKNFLGADSLIYLDKNDLSDAVGNTEDNFCFACFDGNYPIDIHV